MLHTLVIYVFAGTAVFCGVLMLGVYLINLLIKRDDSRRATTKFNKYWCKK